MGTSGKGPGVFAPQLISHFLRAAGGWRQVDTRFLRPEDALRQLEVGRHALKGFKDEGTPGWVARLLQKASENGVQREKQKGALPESALYTREDFSLCAKNSGKTLCWGGGAEGEAW